MSESEARDGGRDKRRDRMYGMKERERGGG